MSVYSRVADLPAGTAWVVHRSCGAGYRVEDADDGWGKLVCESCASNALGTGYGAFTAQGYPPTGAAMGGQPFTPVPHWLLRGEGPKLDLVEHRLVLAIWSHEHGRAGAAWPRLETLAKETGCGVSTIKRALGRLEKRGLLARVRSQGRHPTRYQVADLVRGDANWPAPAPQLARSGPVNWPAPGLEVEPEEVEPSKESLSIDRVARQARDAPSSTSADRPPRCDEGDPLLEAPAIAVEGVAAVEPAQDVHDPALLHERPAVPNTEPVEAAVERLVGPVHVLEGVEGAHDGGLAAAGGGAGSAGGGVGGLIHGGSPSGNGVPEATEQPGGYIGGPCPDPLRCRHWKRHANGPWTCEHNHPRVAGAVR